MRTNKIVAASSLTLLLILTGCDNKDDSANTAPTMSIEHAQGTTNVPLRPQKVVVLNPATLDTLDALKIPVAGVPQTSAHWPSFMAKYSGADYFNTGTLFEPDYEKLSAEKPDLIIAGGRAHDAYDKLSAIAPTIALDVDYQHFLPSLSHRTEQLAAIFGKEDDAKKLLAAFNQKINLIKGKTAHAGSAMVLMVTGGKISAYGPQSRFGFLFDELRFKPAAVFPNEGPHGNIVSAEFLLNANPDWLFVLDRDSAIGRSDGESARQVLDNPLVEKTGAWQKHQILYMDSTAMYIAGGLQSYSRLMDEINTALDRASSAAD